MYKEKRKSEQGQVIILLVFAFIALFGFLALVTDGGMLFSEKRQAQNAADNAALASALAKCTGEANFIPIGLDYAAKHGFNNDGTQNWVTVNNPPSSGPHTGNSSYIEVLIKSKLATSFLHFVYNGPFEVTSRAVAYCKKGSAGGSGEYALFAFGDKCSQKNIDGSGSNNEINGDTHSNTSIYVGGSSNDFNGETTYVTTIDEGSNTYAEAPEKVGVRDVPMTFDIADYRPGGKYALLAGSDYHSYTSKITDLPYDGLYYTTDEIDISPSGINKTVTLVAEGPIKISGSSFDLYPYSNGLLVFSNKKYSNTSDICSNYTIAYSGSNHADMNGFIYSPYGMVELSGSNSTINGGIIGFTIRLNGSNLIINYDASFWPPDPSTVSLAE